MPISTLNMGVSTAYQWRHSWLGRVMKDLPFRGITLQAGPSSLRCVVEMKDQRQPLPLACLCGAACPAAKKKITGFKSRRIKCGLRINGFLNTQHHLHKKQQAGYVGGLLYFSLNVQSEWAAWSEQVWKEADKAVKEHISSWIHKSLQWWNGKQAVETFFVTGEGAGAYR